MPPVLNVLPLFASYALYKVFLNITSLIHLFIRLF